MIDPNKRATDLTAKELHDLLLSVLVGHSKLTAHGEPWALKPVDLERWPGPFEPTPAPEPSEAE